MRRRWALVAVAVSVAIVAAGCGSGPRLTKEQLDARVASICAGYSARADKELEQIDFDPTAQEATSEQVARFGRTIAHADRLFHEQLVDLRSLRPPAADAARYREALALYTQIDGMLDRLARLARRGDRAGLALAVAGLNGVSDQVAALGFRCG